VIRNCVRDNFHWCVIWGIVLQCLGGFVPLASSHPLLALLGWLMLSTGTLLVLIGFAYYAKAKRRSPAWALLALASIIGWLILLSLAAKPGSGQIGDGLARGQ
jgi:multisubunit Na+/H+ antiporter MnhB subunit